MALTQVSSGLISSVANTAITGNIISSQITSVANTQVTGLITASQIATVANTQVTGLITSGQIATVANTQITGILGTSNGGTGVTTSTGSGNNVLSTSPTLVTPVLGTPTSVTLTNGTGLPLTTGVTGTLPIANGGTGTTSTTFVNLTSNVTGTLPIANGGTNSTATPTAGGVVYGNGSAHAITSAGSSGQVLTSAGTGTPTWSTPSAGAMTLISTQTANNTSSTISFTGLSGYSNYVLIFKNLSSSYVSLIFGTGTGPTYITSGYYISVIWGSTYNTTIGGIASNPQSQIQLSNNQWGSSSGADGMSGNFTITNMLNTNSANTSIFGQSIGYVSPYPYEQDLVAATLTGSLTPKTAIQIQQAGYINFVSGSVSLYGISS